MSAARKYKKGRTGKSSPGEMIELHYCITKIQYMYPCSVKEGQSRIYSFQEILHSE